LVTRAPFPSKGRGPGNAQGLGPLTGCFKRLCLGTPSRPPTSPASVFSASLAAGEPRIDAGPRVSQACVTAPRRQGGLSESEGTVRAALRPAPFRSAEPARPGRGEGGTRPGPSQPHAFPPPRNLGPRATPQSPDRAAGGIRAGTGGEGGSEERAESRVSVCGSRAPSPGRGLSPPDSGCPREGLHPRPVGDHSYSAGVQGPSLQNGSRETGESPAVPHLAKLGHRNSVCSGPAPAWEAQGPRCEAVLPDNSPDPGLARGSSRRSSRRCLATEPLGYANPAHQGCPEAQARFGHGLQLLGLWRASAIRR
jgi:hypothetical protein